MELSELQNQLDALTQREFQEVALMRGVAADLTASAYMIEAVHQMLDNIEVRKASLVQRIANLTPAIPAHPVPPPLPNTSEVDDFVGRIAERFRPVTQDHPQDPYGIADWAQQKRVGA